MPKNEFLGIIAKHYKITEFKFASLKFEYCHFDVTDNLDFNIIKASEFPDGFLYFKYRIEVTFESGLDINKCISFVTKVLLFFWEQKIPAVASCDYEFRLPELGGYNSRNIPWVD